MMKPHQLEAFMKRCCSKQLYAGSGFTKVPFSEEMHICKEALLPAYRLDARNINRRLRYQ